MCEDVESLKIFRTGIENNSRNRPSGIYEEKCGKKTGSPELSSISLPQNPTGVSQNVVRSNGSCSDASGSSETEALFPQLDSFKEEERAQWEPLSGDKFGRQKNTPRLEEILSFFLNI